jgi:hypothetical protein
MTSSDSWPPGQSSAVEQQFGNMDTIGEQDYANLIDFESFEFLTNFEPNGENAHKISNSVDLNILANAANQSQHEGQRGAGQSLPQGQNMFDMQMQMGFGQPQHGQPFSMAPNGGHTIQTHPMVPPTPNSVEMHGDVGRYLQQLDAQTRAMIEHEYRMKQDTVSCHSFIVLLSVLSSCLAAFGPKSRPYASSGMNVICARRLSLLRMHLEVCQA